MTTPYRIEQRVIRKLAWRYIKRQVLLFRVERLIAKALLLAPEDTIEQKMLLEFCERWNELPERPKWSEIVRRAKRELAALHEEYYQEFPP